MRSAGAASVFQNGAPTPNLFLKRGNDENDAAIPNWGLKTPSCSDSPFRSPPTSVPRGPSYSPMIRIRQERELMQTPKPSDRAIRDLCRGASFVKPPQWLDILAKVLPVVIFVSCVLLFVFPPCAAVFVVALALYGYVRGKLKKAIEIGEKQRPVPSFAFPARTKPMLF